MKRVFENENKICIESTALIPVNMPGSRHLVPGTGIIPATDAILSISMGKHSWPR